MGFGWVHKQRWALLILSIILVSFVGAGAKNLVQTADYKVYFESNDKDLLASEALSNSYSKSDNILFVIAPKSGNIFSQKTLTLLANLTESSWQIPYSTRVDSIINYQHSYAEGDDLIIEDLVNINKVANKPYLQQVKNTALNEPNLVNRLISKKGDVSAVNVTINFTPGQVDTQTREVVAYARKIADQIRQASPDVQVHLTGIVMMNNAFPETSEKDGATLIPLMLILILIGLFLLLRSFSAVIASLTIILLSIVAAMGFAGFIGYKINPVSGAAPIIILTIAVADCVHILMSYVNNLRNKKQPKPQAIQEAMAVNVKPVLLTTLSTAIGFLTMNFSEAPPFRELGNIAAVGIIAACILSLTLLPALLNILPIKHKQTAKPQNKWLNSAMNACAKLVLKKYNLVLGLGLSAAILIASGAMKNELNEDFIRYFDESFEVRVATEFTLENLTGINIVEYDIKATAKGQIVQPAYLNNLDKFTAWLYQQPEVIHVNTFSDTIKRLNKNINQDDPAFYQIPSDHQLTAQLVLLYETSLPFGLGITDRVKLDKSATRLTVTLNDITNNELLAFEQRSQTWMQQNLPATMHAQGLGWSVMFGGIAQKNITSMLNATLLAVFMISVVLILPFKSVRLGILSIIPNVLPALVALGIWGLTVGMIGLAASIITALTFGIVVDDSIHFITRYIRNRRELGLPANEAIQQTFLTVGKAIVVTSIVLIAGFSMLATSGFKVNSIIGYLSALTIFIALVMDLFILPALLYKLDPWLFKSTTQSEQYSEQLKPETNAQ
ncbi:efflux RND transporter permease subunit [Algibacillus agarilyticus]|uniref:efflux RND transporter permease subunit n=1 Tax=Algibacillus agarilyticus TaxID=2234133 RepID=UPI000DD0748A|nr:efflux RND transporter permease subunit [Algibacillus agarilyticus]